MKRINVFEGARDDFINLQKTTRQSDVSERSNNVLSERSRNVLLTTRAWMDGNRFEMAQKERDRLMVLHEAERGRITQRQAAEQLGITERQVRRLVARLRIDRGPGGHTRFARPKRRTAASMRRWSGVQWRSLSKRECRDFGPTYAAEHFV